MKYRKLLAKTPIRFKLRTQKIKSSGGYQVQEFSVGSTAEAQPNKFGEYSPFMFDDKEWGNLCTYRKFDLPDSGSAKLARILMHIAITKYCSSVTERLSRTTIPETFGKIIDELNQLEPPIKKLRDLNFLRQRFKKLNLFGKSKASRELTDQRFREFNRFFKLLKEVQVGLPEVDKGRKSNDLIFELVKELNEIQLQFSSEGRFIRSTKPRNPKFRDTNYLTAIFSMIFERTNIQVTSSNIQTALKDVIDQHNKKIKLAN
jgi:hypothetical protein